MKLSKAYCLNLEKRPEKKRRMTLRFELLGIKPEFIKAVDGLKIPAKKGFSPGQLGVVQSWIDFLESQKNTTEEFIFFCEDDIVFAIDFKKRFEKFYNQLPEDWDMIYLGWYPNTNGKTIPVTKNVFRLNYQQGCFCFIFKTKLIPEILEGMKKKNQVADNVFGWLIQSKYKCYGFKPFLCYVQEGISDTWHRHMTYPTIKYYFKHDYSD